MIGVELGLVNRVRLVGADSLLFTPEGVTGSRRRRLRLRSTGGEARITKVKGGSLFVLAAPLRLSVRCCCRCARVVEAPTLVAKLGSMRWSDANALARGPIQCDGQPLASRQS